MRDACFACESAATTREHVPPVCLFPERKDAQDGQDLRRNLITVPSCADHNAAKSADDLYLLWVLSTNVVANAVGMRQALTKLGRGHKRRPALGESILQKTTDVIVRGSRSGAEHEAAEAPLDTKRFDRVLTLVARGIYRLRDAADQTLSDSCDRTAGVDRPISSIDKGVQVNRLTLLILLTTLSAGLPSAKVEAQAPGSSDEAAIKALMVQTTNAFNKHDAKAWGRFCTSDARLVTVRGESMIGVGEIVTGLGAIFETRGRTAVLKTLDIAVRFIRPDVALAYVTNEMSGVSSPTGDQQPPHTELSIRVLVKDHGMWRITAFHNTIVQR